MFKDSEMHFTITFWYTHPKLLFHILISVESVIRCYWKGRDCQFDKNTTHIILKKIAGTVYVGNLKN